ncbi:DMT family transporter [Primorskyibacter sp. S87]|uniref:DMT family transporter n=1 Tax=Primorskyibacter sp. S87 TaxID=3415126 RepID=UPI003C7AB276
MKAGNLSPQLAAGMMMLCAMLILGIIDNLIPLVAREIGLWQFHFVRTLMALPLICSLSLLGLGAVRPNRPGVLVLRSALVGMSMLLYFSALALMPISQALAGLFTSPIFILLISATLLGQRIGPWRVLAVATGFVGILCVLQPDPQDFELLVFLPVGAGFFYALGAIVTNRLCKDESTVALLVGLWVFLGIMGALGLLILQVWPIDTLPGPQGFVTRSWVWPIWQSFPWIVVQAIGSVFAVFLIIRAYQVGDPTRVGVFEFSIMIFGPLFGWLAFGAPIGIWQIAGIGLICLAGVIIALRSK